MTSLEILGTETRDVRPAFAPFPPELARAAVDALYVHVPFCSTKCHYCDFYSLAGHLDQTEAFLEALRREVALLERQLGRPSPRTIFIGGGTPTLLTPPQLKQLLDILRGGMDLSRLEEFTVEANPNTFDPERAAVLAANGINRLSFGAQSFHPAELRTLQRDHDPENVPRAFEIAREAGISNLNLDLIFGIPGQTLASWESSLAQGLALAPQHMSCYSLTYEPNTAMTARLKRGEFVAIDEDLELEMFDHVYSRLRNAGFTRYEVSNYALPGRECLHNLQYWKGANWLAWGPSAAGHLNGWRWKNVGSLAHYLEALSPPAGAPVLPWTQVEHLSPRHWAGEVATFWLRLSEGLVYAEFQDRTGVEARGILEKALRKFVAMGFVELREDRALLTEKAVPVSNTILRDALAAFEE